MKTVKLIATLILASFPLLGCGSEQSRFQAEVAQEVAKRLMDREAERSVPKLFDTNFESSRSTLIEAPELQAWVRDRKIDTRALPVHVQEAIRNKRTIALLVEDVIPKASTSGSGGRFDLGPGVFLPIFDFDMGGFWIHDMGPCNGSDLVQVCTGCSGIGCDGLAHTCICTRGCPPEKPCPPCKTCPQNGP